MRPRRHIDDPSIRNSLKWLIESIGLTVKTCESAEEYLRAYVDAPGCLVTDLRMPGADGMEVLGADLRNGLLSVDLARPEPERIVKTIAINDHE